MEAFEGSDIDNTGLLMHKSGLEYFYKQVYQNLKDAGIVCKDPSSVTDSEWKIFYDQMNSRCPWEEGISLADILEPDYEANALIFF